MRVFLGAAVAALLPTQGRKSVQRADEKPQPAGPRPQSAEVLVCGCYAPTVLRARSLGLMKGEGTNLEKQLSGQECRQFSKAIKVPMVMRRDESQACALLFSIMFSDIPLLPFDVYILGTSLRKSRVA